MSELTRRQKLEAMLAEDPKDEFLRYGVAMDYAAVGDHETAAQQFRVLITSNPTTTYVPAYLMAAQSLLKIGKRLEAIPLLKEGIVAAKKQGDDHAAGEMEGLLESLE
jgi:predicted Zn-dependent protease